MQRNLLNKLGPFSLLLVIYLVAKTEMSDENEAYMNKGFRALEGSAFYALRSCHQVLRGDSGEFFSPDYLCSSPGLWCNWTIQVPRGKRVQLYLEDLTSVHDCHLKTDQIHLDESPVAVGESSILEKCWMRARYTSISDTVHVVQLIGPDPNPPHRGFYGRYQVLDPQEPSPSEAGDTVEEDLLEEVDADDLEDEDSMTYVPDQSNIQPKTGNPLDQNTLHGIKWMKLDEAEDGEIKLPEEDFTSPVERVENLLLTQPEEVTQLLTSETSQKNSGEIRKTRGGAEAQTKTAEGAPCTVTADKTHNTDTTTVSTMSTTTTTTKHSESTEEMKQAVSTSASSNKTRAAELNLKSTRSPEETPPAVAKIVSSSTRKETDDMIFVEVPLTDGDGSFQAGAVELNEGFEELIKLNSTGKHKLAHTVKGQTLSVQSSSNPSEPPHLPGGLLVEVTVEIDVGHAHRESWDHMKSLFRNAVENLIKKDLDHLHPKSISSKRSKKLNSGVLLIVWVQFDEGDDGVTFGVLQSTLQGLRGKNIHPRNTRSHGTITSISVEDVDECQTHMVMCDVNAECVNEFASYSCHCHHGYSPGLGGAVCVEPEAEDCVSLQTSFPLLLYGVCVLLCLLIAVLLVVLIVLYRRSHRGAYLPRCHSSSSRSFTANTNDGNNNNNHAGSGIMSGVDSSPSRTPPPPPPPLPPPLHLSKQASTSLDLPLLKFTPLTPTQGLQDKSHKDHF